MAEEKESAKGRLRNRSKRGDSKDSVVENERIKTSVKSTEERPEKEASDEPAEDNKIKGDDVAARISGTPDWENIFRINIEFDGISVLLFVISFLTRTYRLSQPNHIVFDELHYGKYIRHYNEKTFFFDQHPPLGKQLIAAVTNLVGFGNYTFSKIGASYDEVSLIQKSL